MIRRRNAASAVEDAARWEQLGTEGALEGGSIEAWESRSYPLFRDAISNEALQAIDDLGGEGVRFTLEGLAREMDRVAGARGRPLARATLRRRLRSALEELERARYVRRAGDGYEFTLLGAEAALASRVIPARRAAEEFSPEDFGEQYAAWARAETKCERSELGRRGRPGAPVLIAPHAAAPRPCKHCEIKHRLGAHRRHAVEGVPVGEVLAQHAEEGGGRLLVNPKPGRKTSAHASQAEALCRRTTVNDRRQVMKPTKKKSKPCPACGTELPKRVPAGVTRAVEKSRSGARLYSISSVRCGCCGAPHPPRAFAGGKNGLAFARSVGARILSGEFGRVVLVPRAAAVEIGDFALTKVNKKKKRAPVGSHEEEEE